MSYKIVADSSCDLTEEMRGWNDFEIVPLTLEIGDYSIKDDENFDQDDFISRMKAYSGTAKSACPSPEAWKKSFEGDYDEIYVVTITDKLSGTYNSALQGKALYEEEFNDNKKIHIFNSLSAVGGETLITMKIKELAESGASFDEVVEKIEKYKIENTDLYFCLESLDALKSNGRLFALAAGLLEKIRIKLICKKTTEGNITLSGQDLTINRAIIKMINIMAEQLKDKDLSSETVVITYVCCEDRAKLVAGKIKEKLNFGRVEILKGAGLNSLYASDGGIVVSFTY